MDPRGIVWGVWVVAVLVIAGIGIAASRGRPGGHRFALVASVVALAATAGAYLLLWDGV